jgi:hypothetical protein
MRATSSPPTAALEKPLGIKDLQALLGISHRGLLRKVRLRQVPSPNVKAGRNLFWMPSTVRAWLEGGNS